MTNQKIFLSLSFIITNPPPKTRRFFRQGAWITQAMVISSIFFFCEMIECRDDSSCADHGYNSADSDSYRAAGSDEADRKGNDDGGEIKKIFSEAHVLSAALAR